MAAPREKDPATLGKTPAEIRGDLDPRVKANGVPTGELISPFDTIADHLADIRARLEALEGK